MTTRTSQRPIGPDERSVRIVVPDMDCPSCVTKIEGALDRRDGILDAEVRLPSKEIIATFDPDRTDEETVIKTIEKTGYAVERPSSMSRRVSSPHALWRSDRAVFIAIGAMFLLLGAILKITTITHDPLLGSLVGRSFSLSDVFFLVSILVAGSPILRNGYYSARARSLDIDFLMSVGILGAVFAHLPFEGATLAVLFSVAKLLERFSLDRARHSLHELMELAPNVATVRRGDREVTVPVDDVVIGDVVTVRSGERLPMDGIVVEGEGVVNQAPITGESVPIDVTVGDDVYSGTINEAGYLEIEVTSVAAESAIARIIRLVEDAQTATTEREQFVNRFARYYTPIVVVAAAMTAFVPPVLFGAPWGTWYLRGLTLLVIACPCAFVISTPVSVVSGITSAARNGVLIKGGNHLESMGEVDVIAFDKTGTLTTGELSITEVIPLNDMSVDEVLSCASTLEQRSEHPIGRAIVDHTEGDAGELDHTHAFDNERADRWETDESRSIANFEILPGRGVRAELDGIPHYAGTPELFMSLGFDLKHEHVSTDGGRSAPMGEPCERGGCVDLANETIPALQRAGKTLVIVGTADKLEGIIAIADQLRPEASGAISDLRDRGIRTVLLTGDNAGTAYAIANATGIDEVHAGLLPEEKVELIESIGSREDCVAMVGDGINDAPALARATVGIAMGAAGTDTVLETADVALMSDDLSRVPYLVTLSRRANGVIRQNIWSSLVVKAVLAIGAPFGLVTVVHAVVVGDMGMSLAVTGNAMRLSDIRPPE